MSKVIRIDADVERLVLEAQRPGEAKQAALSRLVREAIGTMTCCTCGKPIEEYPDAFSGGWTHADIDAELSADHSAEPEA